MGPIRGVKRRKNTEPKRLDQNVLAAATLSPQPEPLDWWEEFQQIITGKEILIICFVFISVFLLPCYCLILCYWVVF